MQSSTAGDSSGSESNVSFPRTTLCPVCPRFSVHKIWPLKIISFFLVFLFYALTISYTYTIYLGHIHHRPTPLSLFPGLPSTHTYLSRFHGVCVCLAGIGAVHCSNLPEATPPEKTNSLMSPSSLKAPSSASFSSNQAHPVIKSTCAMNSIPAFLMMWALHQRPGELENR